MIAGEADSETGHEEDALHVFLLMGKEYRISRSIRAQWFFQQFNSTLPQPKPHDELIDSNEELEVLSVISSDLDNDGPTRLVPSTHITFIGRRYRFVFCLDISPSLATVDIQSGTVITDEAFEKFKNCLTGLVAPFSVPGNNIVLSPELFITVLAYTSILNPEAPQILIQGCLVTEQNVNTVLELVHNQLMELEDFLAKTTSTLCCDASEKINRTESDQKRMHSNSVTLMSPEAGPISILRNTLLALQLLPSNASAGAVVITDGVFALPNASAVDSLLAQLRASTVCCSFIKVGSGFHAHCSLGYVPHCDMMQFIAMASSGAYLAKAPPVSREGRRVDGGDDYTMNLYHKSLLCWNFQRDFDLSKIDSWIGDYLELSEEDLAWALKGKRSISYALSEWEQNAMQPSMRKRHLETKLHTSITSVLSVRLREGYSIQDVSIAKGGKQLQVRLTVPWKHNVQIEYLALSAWPLSPANCMTHVEVTIEAPYEFLHDVTYPMKQPATSANTSYRTLVVRRFRQTMKSLQSTDEMLVHLQSFSSNPSYYTIPESAKNGVPLFYLPPNSNNPVLSLQHGRKSSKSKESQFAVFWKPVLSLDTTGWQRWMHCHRIGLVLEHDVPLPKNLHLPLENDRSSAIQCRVALSSLNGLFRNWSSFVLLENHSYIKFITSQNPEDAPSSFCITRITAKGPCIVIKVAFLGGTEGYIRHEIVSDLKTKLSQITAPLGVTAKPPAKSKNLHRVAQLSNQRTVIEKPCSIMFEKPLEKILVRYERIPKDLFSPFPEQPTTTVFHTLTGVYAHRTNENHMKILCQYLHHHRWIWTMQDEGSPGVTADGVARVLSTLTKLRLQEGYNFVSNTAGIITMAKELKMKDHTKDTDQVYSCIIQYVLFPPYRESIETEHYEESVVDWAYKGKRRFFMVTEVWAEPQFGRLTDLNSELKYLEGLQYNQVPNAIYQVDLKHVGALLTSEHLWDMTDDPIVSTPHRTVEEPKPDSGLTNINWLVEQLPFPFDVIGLLPKSRQVELVFSSLFETSPVSDDNSDSPNENLFKLLLENMERLNDREVILYEEDWQRFTQHIQSRQRNGVPLPFPEELCHAKDSDDSTSRDEEGKVTQDKKSRNKSGSLIKWKCFIRAVKGVEDRGSRLIITFLPASFKYIRLIGRYQRSRSSSTGSSSPRSPHHTEEMGPEGATEESSSMGESKAQKLSVSLLSQGSVEESSATPTPTAEKDESTFAFSQKRGDFPDSEGKPKTSPGHDDEKKSVTFQENTTPINEGPVFHDRRISKENDSTFSLNIPIYCYDCPKSALLSIPDSKSDTEVTSEEANKREDIYQDFTQFAAQIMLDPFNPLDEVPRSIEGRTIGRFGSSKDLLLHCTAVHDLFFRSFVTSTYSSLQRGQQVSMRDVHSAVDACEENFLEVDITEFIRTLCGHYVRHNRDKEELEVKINAELSSVPIRLPSLSMEERVKDLKNTLSGECESVSGLHKSITAKFFAILGRYFQAVPPSKEYFFFCPQQSDGPRKSIPESFSESETFEADQTAEDDKDSDMGSDAFDDIDTVLIEDDGTVQLDDMDDVSDFESEGSDIEFEGDTEDDHDIKSPLFLLMTCTLRDSSSFAQPMTPVSINTLPVCLGEIIRKLEDDEDCLDPFSPSVRITLDLICLTLSPEPDYSVLKSSARSAPSRSNSFSSTSSPVSLSPSDKRSGSFDYRRQDSKAMLHDIDGVDSGDPLHGLRHSQRVAINNTREAIRWLLQDEIVSELRHIGPVNKTMLEKVENHVKQYKEDHPSCISRHVQVQFVYGAEQSLELFVKEFERISLPEYMLNETEKYYYLTGFVEKQIAVVSPLVVEGESSGLMKEEQKSADDESGPSTPNAATESSKNGEETGIIFEFESSGLVKEEQNLGDDISGPTTPNVVADTSMKEEETVMVSGGENTLEPQNEANGGLLAIYVEQDSAVAQQEENASNEPPAVTVSNEEDTTADGETTPPSKHPHLGEVGKQPPTEEEPEPDSPAAATPVKDSSFASSAGSTPVGKLRMPTVDVNVGEEEGDSSLTPSPRTPRQEEQEAGEFAEEYLQFWLVMRIFEKEVAIFFHRRESDDPKSFSATRANGLVEMVTNAIHEKCKIVNQRMLLHELYETKMCNSMLFPESDEDIWKHEDMQISVSPLGIHISKGDSKGRITSKFVQVQFLFQPGHFGCNSVWHTHLPVHQRLFDNSGRTGISRGIKAIRSVLDRFGVSNRKDMFVYKDSTGAVFYFRLFESLCSSDSSNLFPSELRAPDDDDDDEGRSGLSSVASLAGSRTSSILSLVKVGTGELDEDVLESKLKKQFQSSERDTASDNGRSIHSVQPVIDKSIALHVYGVDEPGPEITVELVEVLQNRIDEAMLEVLSVLFSRNPNCKMTYADVRFIQPQGQPPKTTLTLLIPPMDVNFLCPLAFYLRQNLLQFLFSPRYMDSDPSHHFKAVSGSKTEATGSATGESCRLEPEVYLYNRPHSSGGKGLACISVSVLNSRGGYIYIPCGKTASVYVGELDYFEPLTDVFLCTDEHQLAEDDIMVQFAIWERGDIGLDPLTGQLKLALRHALCDLLTEYYLLAAPLSKVPKMFWRSLITRTRSSSEPPSPIALTPKVPPLGSLPETSDRTSKRQLDFGSQSGFRSRRSSFAGQRRTPSVGSHLSALLSVSNGAQGRTQQNPFLSQRQSVSGPYLVSRQSTVEDDVFSAEPVSPGVEAMEMSYDGSKTSAQEMRESSSTLPPEEEKAYVQTPSKIKVKATDDSKKQNKGDTSSDVEPTFETFTAAEIQESQEFTSQPGTPITEHMTIYVPNKDQLTEREKPPSLSSAAGSKASSLSGLDSSSVSGQPSDGRGTWQDIEFRRRKEQDKRRRRIQYENGERGELHPSLQGLGQDMFSFFRDLGVPSVYCIEGKLINNFASDAFLAELSNLISLVCPDMKPKVYREAPLDSADGKESDTVQETHCLHYYPARQPLKVQDADESSVDRSGKPFTALPNSSHFFVVVGRNVDQWRASLGLEEDLSHEDELSRPRIRTGLQRFKPLDPNTPIPGRMQPDSASLASLSVGGVPRQKFLLVTIMDKDVIAFTYNWNADLNQNFDKKLHRLLNWSNARCHLTSCLLSQKMGLFHHTLFADINKGKEQKDMNPFCLSANDKDMVLLISHPGPPSLDRERAMPRQMLPAPNILVFDEVLRDVTPPKPLYRTPYFHNRDPVKRHGYQFQEIRSVQIKKAILAQNLDELYIMWQRRPPHVQISEDKIETLKRSSRLIHYCAAPLLFHPEWRRLRSSSGLENNTVSQDEPPTEEKKEETKERKTSKVQKPADVQEKKKEEPVNQTERMPPSEEAWHHELRSAYMQQYVQYMQSLQFLVVQTRPQSPKPTRRHPGRPSVSSKPRRESSPADLKKQNSKDRKDSTPKAMHCYLQRSSPGGIMLMELVFQGCFFIVRLYALGCSQIPSGKTVGVQMCRMFVEDCNRYREYIHLLSFNYDFHLCKAQLYLNGSQRIFNKGYGVTQMLTGLLVEYSKCPLFARNRLCNGEISVPLHPGISPQAVFNFLVKNAAKYEFSTLPLRNANGTKSSHVLLGTDRVLTQERNPDPKSYDILRDNNEYDISFVVSLKDSTEEGVVTMEYVVLMTSRRELFPKLMLDLRLRKKSPSSSSLSTMSGNRMGSFPEGENEQGRGSRVRFILPSSSSSGSLGVPNPPSPGEFHRSASSPHSLFTLGNDNGGSQVFKMTPSRSDESIAEQRRDSLPTIVPLASNYEESSTDDASQKESRLLTEAFQRARDHLVHIACRAQTHCNRDLLWHRLLAGESEDEGKDGAKKTRKKSVMRKSTSELNLKQSWIKNLDPQSPGAEQVSAPRMTYEEFEHLLSIVGSKSLKNEDTQLIPLLSMRASWYMNLFRVITAKFPDSHRLYSSEDNTVHYLAILNPESPDMFVLLYVDENNDSSDISVVFREDLSDDSGSLLNKKTVRSHIYSVINAVCFHLWTTLLPA